jgi:hypothetical protein
MLVQIFAKNRMRMMVFVVASLFAVASFAQEESEEEAPAAPPAEQRAQRGKNQTVYMEFGNELIDGVAANPSVEYVFSRSQFNYKRLIRLRDNFQPEVKQGRGDFSGSR